MAGIFGGADCQGASPGILPKGILDIELAGDGSSVDPLVLLATDGNVTEVRAKILSGQSTVNEQDSNGYTALMAAASYGQLEVVRFLLSVADVQVNLVDAEGDSALHYCRDVECMKLLIASDGNLKLMNGDELNPLQSMEQELEEITQDHDSLDDPAEAEKLKEIVAFIKSL